MDAHKRVADARVRAVITEYRGNVAAAAGLLKMSRNNLYQRLWSLGVDIPALRKGHTVSLHAGGSISVRRRAIPPRVTPEHQELLRQAKFDLMAHYRQDFDETTILAAFIQDDFAGWLKRGSLPLGNRTPQERRRQPHRPPHPDRRAASHL